MKILNLIEKFVLFVVITVRVSEIQGMDKTL